MMPVKVTAISEEYRAAGALNTLIQVCSFLDEHTFLTKSGDLGVVFRIHGIDYEGCDKAELDGFARRFERALRGLSEDFRLYQYLLKRAHPHIPFRRYSDDEVVDRAIQGRIEFLRAKADSLYSLELYFVLLYHAVQPAGRESWRQRLGQPRTTLTAWLSGQQHLTTLASDLAERERLLAARAESFLIQLQDFVQAELLDKQSAFSFLTRLLNYAPYRSDTMQLKYDQDVDQQLAASTLECHRDRLQLNAHQVKVLSVIEPPARTFAHMLRSLLELPSNVVVASEWKRVSNLKMRRAIRTKRRHFHNSKTSLANYLSDAPMSDRQLLVDDADEALVHELGGALQEMEVNGSSFGEWSMTVILYDLDRAKLDRAVAECVKRFATQDATVMEERYNLLNAWLSVLPGNHQYNLRRLFLLDSNCADLSFLFTLSLGEPHNQHLDQEYLAVLETNQGTPYFLNLHHQDNAHTVILGASGAGKTTMLNALATFIDPAERVVLIEETSEVRVVRENLVEFEARREQPGRPAVTIRDLLRATLRHRPDRILVGEVRGGEAFDLLQALNTGHSGTLSTIHANSAKLAISRFITCVLQSGVELPYRAIRSNIADALDLVLHVERRNRRRYVAELLRLARYDPNQDQYEYELVYGADGALR